MGDAGAFTLMWPVVDDWGGGGGPRENGRHQLRPIDRRPIERRSQQLRSGGAAESPFMRIAGLVDAAERFFSEIFGVVALSFCLPRQPARRKSGELAFAACPCWPGPYSPPPAR